jgi:hypothetical protein
MPRRSNAQEPQPQQLNHLMQNPNNAPRHHPQPLQMLQKYLMEQDWRRLAAEIAMGVPAGRNDIDIHPNCMTKTMFECMCVFHGATVQSKPQSAVSEAMLTHRSRITQIERKNKKSR